MGHRDYDSYNNTGKDDSEFQFTLSPDIWLSADDIKANESEFSFFPSDEPKPEPKRRRRRKKSRVQSIFAAAAGIILALAVVLPLMFHKSPAPSNQEPLLLPSETIPAPKPTEPTPKPTKPAPKPTEPAPKPTEPAPKPTEPAPTQPPRPAGPDQSLYFFRSLLSGDDLADYDTILQAAKSFEPQVTDIRAKTPEQVWRTYACVWNDHPELFWMDAGSGSCSYNSTGVSYLNMKYTMSRADAVRYQEQMETKVAPLLSQLANVSEYEKLLGVYEYIINNTVYQLLNTSPSAVDILVNGRGRCADYAVATTYLLNKLGMQSIYVTGDAIKPDEIVLHAWNIVRVNGNYYQVDTTWGDPVMEDGSQSINYGYFCLTTEEMSKDHSMDHKYPYPNCTDPSLGYYRMKGRYVETYDEQSIAAWLSQCSPDKIDVTFKCATESLAENYRTQLYENHKLWKILETVFPNDQFGMMYWNVNGKVFSITGQRK